METPCIGTCKIDPQSRLCLGCFRSIDEITAWTSMSDLHRARVIAQLPERHSRDTKRVPDKVSGDF
ncbi:MAG: DUF1289 domain-containing protein [Pseudomonadota bacterium]